MSIHSTAIVSPQAELGSGVIVGPYSIIGPKVVLHDRVVVDSHCVIEGPTEIGEGSRLFPFVSCGSIPQDLKYRGEESRLVIGRNTRVREYVTINRGTEGGGNVTSIGDDCLIMTQSHVAHDSKVGNHVILANAATLAGHVTIEDYATVGAFSGVHQFCRIGKYSYIGGYSVITLDTLPYSLCVGNRAKCYGVNSIGLQRKNFSKEVILEIERAIKTLIRSKLNTSQALESLRQSASDVSEVQYIIQFVEASTRGVLK